MSDTDVKLTSLLKARAVFERFRKNLNTEQDKAGAVQAFEFCYELSWKTMQKALNVRGVRVGTPRDAFREAAAASLIKNPKVWFEFIKKRNETVHVYNEDTLEAVIGIFDLFSSELTTFIENLEKKQ